MPDSVTQRAGWSVLLCDPDGSRIADPQDALDLIGTALSEQAEVVAVPVSRLDEQFFTLGTGLAGEVMQKFVNYRTRLVVVGDISAFVTASTALRDLVRESNRGLQAWFVADLDELDIRLAGVRSLR
jgi:hypothetical protein